MGYENMCCYNNCNRILTEAHRLIKESNILFDDSNEIISNCVAGCTKKALIELNKAREIHKEGKELENKAYYLFFNSGCDFNCNRNSCESKCYENVIKDIETKREYIREDIELKLKEALNLIDRYEKLGCKLNNYIYKYTQTIHGKNPCTNPCEYCDDPCCKCCDDYCRRY